MAPSAANTSSRWTKTARPSGTTYQAYYVVGSDHGLTDPPVAVIGRNNRTGMQVWSADWGYPGDGDYREFHKKDHMSGMQYWRVTGAQSRPGQQGRLSSRLGRMTRCERTPSTIAQLIEDLVPELPRPRRASMA